MTVSFLQKIGVSQTLMRKLLQAFSCSMLKLRGLFRLEGYGQDIRRLNHFRPTKAPYSHNLQGHRVIG